MQGRKSLRHKERRCYELPRINPTLGADPPDLVRGQVREYIYCRWFCAPILDVNIDSMSRCLMVLQNLYARRVNCIYK
jgi:hypothetical protein